MSLERLVAEIEARGQADLAAEERRRTEELARISTEREHRLTSLRAESERLTRLDVLRERQQRLASAKLQARKLEYEARERRTTDALERTRRLLARYTGDPEYPQLLRRMYAYATSELGREVRVMGRAEDAALLKSVAGKAFSPLAVPTVGGLVAESADGSRRLNLTFDELLRLREDQVRALLAP